MLARIALLVFAPEVASVKPGCRTHYALFATHCCVLQSRNRDELMSQ